MTLSLTDPSNGTMSFSINGELSSKVITKQLFSGESPSWLSHRVAPCELDLGCVYLDDLFAVTRADHRRLEQRGCIDI